MDKTRKDSSSMTPWSSIGYMVMKRTYARRLGESTDAPTEEWSDVVNRVILGANAQLGVGFTYAEESRLYNYMMQLKGTVAGRFLWQLGTETVGRLGLLSLQNCAFTVIDHPIRPFTWAFDALMLGSGVGYSIQNKHVEQLPRVREDFELPIRQDNASADFIVPDTREGWGQLLQRVLESAFYGDVQSGFTFSTHCIRSKGTPIKGFGGVASGPEDLVKGIADIAGVLAKRRGKRLSSVDCLDIMNIIGAIVVSGNVRRSAQIAIGDSWDKAFLRAKRWDLGNIPSWRAMSNNSVVWDGESELGDDFWHGYEGNGEPYGLINLKLSKTVGRLGETEYPDPKVEGYNPCAEQSLAPYETCCLAELYLPNLTSFEEAKDVATLLYRINKHSLALPCHLKETEDIVHNNMRMGIGVTGYLQATEEQKQWLPLLYDFLRAYDKIYSSERGWPASVKLTTVKPSGTLSLLPGVTSGAHPAYARYLIRRVRVASNHALVDVCRSHGYPVEFMRNFDGSEDHGTVVISFPFSYPEGTKLAADMSAIDQLEVVRRLQKEWSDNAVSCTVYYRLEELDEIKQYLKQHFSHGLKSVSFLLHSDHGFDQAPLEEVSAEEFATLVANTIPITGMGRVEEFAGADECAGGHCPIK
jgi:ribonucleotide reductase alpha subunit